MRIVKDLLTNLFQLKNKTKYKNNCNSIQNKFNFVINYYIRNLKYFKNVSINISLFFIYYINSILIHVDNKENHLCLYILKYRSRKIKTFVTTLQFIMVGKRKKRKKYNNTSKTIHSIIELTKLI